MSFQCTCGAQSTPDNWNLSWGSRKSSSHREFELSGARRIAGGTAQRTFYSHLVVEMLSEN